MLDERVDALRAIVSANHQEMRRLIGAPERCGPREKDGYRLERASRRRPHRADSGW